MLCWFSGSKCFWLSIHLKRLDRSTRVVTLVVSCCQRARFGFLLEVFNVCELDLRSLVLSIRQRRDRSTHIKRSFLKHSPVTEDWIVHIAWTTAVCDAQNLPPTLAWSLQFTIQIIVLLLRVDIKLGFWMEVFVRSGCQNSENSPLYSLGSLPCSKTSRVDAVPARQYSDEALQDAISEDER